MTTPYVPKAVAYNGKMIEFNNEEYSLIPEKNGKSCYGCAFLNDRCTPDHTKYCTQGYIFKKLNFNQSKENKK